MPLLSLIKDNQSAVAIWKIEEQEDQFLNLLTIHDTIPDSITHPDKRAEVIAGKVTTALLLKEFGQTYEGVIKNEHGKPFLKNASFHLSQSHSFPYVAVIISAEENVGIDIEQPKKNLAIVAPRVFNSSELSQTGNDLKKLCIYWCAKETLIKLYGKKDLNLKEEITIDPFTFHKTGNFTGRISRKGHEKYYALHYLVHEDFVLVHN
jgi:4'-phosphopantetheinyl transferase